MDAGFVICSKCGRGSIPLRFTAINATQDEIEMVPAVVFKACQAKKCGHVMTEKEVKERINAWFSVEVREEKK